MSELRITYDGTLPRRGDYWQGVAFSVWSREEMVATAEVGLTNTAAGVMEAHHPEVVLDEEGAVNAAAALEAQVRLGVRRLGRLLTTREGRASLVGAENSHAVWKIAGTEDDLAEAFEPLHVKGCEWQLEDGRGLFCTAARNDPAASRTMDGRRAAPTTRAACAACRVPDEEWLCSWFSHPDVREDDTMDVWFGRDLFRAVCDLGRPEVRNPEGCRAGGHDCWERVVSLEARADVAARSPFDLPESLDFLDAMWRLSFGRDRRLVHLPTAAEAAGLGQPCSDREGFEARMSDLADVLDGFEVADELVPADHGGRGPLSAMKAVLGDRLDEEEAAAAVEAVGTLQTVRRVRVALQHSDAVGELLPSLATLGAPAPPAWGEAWDRIRSVTAEALDTIRAAVRRVDVDGQGT